MMSDENHHPDIPFKMKVNLKNRDDNLYNVMQCI